MAENSKIEWTTHTFNPWEGCTKISPGCANCYAEARNHRFGLDNWGKGKPRRRTKTWSDPVRWNREALSYPDACTNGHRLNQDAQTQIGNDRCPAQVNHEGQFDPTFPRCGAEIIANVRPRVFCASLADWLDDEVPAEWLADLLKLIHDTPNLDWLLLTKRPQNWNNRIRDARNFLTKGGCADTALWLNDWLPTPATSGIYERGRQATSDHPAIPGEPPSNVWIGTTVEDQKRADERIPELLKIPAKVRFLSCEPLLEPIDLWGSEKIDWIIVGGESGPKRRPFNCDWARQIRDQCKLFGNAFFMKQVDKVQPIPEDLMIREFPKV